MFDGLTRKIAVWQSAIELGFIPTDSGVGSNTPNPDCCQREKKPQIQNTDSDLIRIRDKEPDVERS